MNKKEELIEKIYKEDNTVLKKMKFNQIEDEINQELGEDKLNKEQQEKNERLKTYGL